MATVFHWLRHYRYLMWARQFGCCGTDDCPWTPSGRAWAVILSLYDLRVMWRQLISCQRHFEGSPSPKSAYQVSRVVCKSGNNSESRRSGTRSYLGGMHWLRGAPCNGWESALSVDYGWEYYSYVTHRSERRSIVQLSVLSGYASATAP